MGQRDQSHKDAGKTDISKFPWADAIRNTAIGLATIFSAYSGYTAEQAKQAADGAKRASEERLRESQITIEVYRLVEKALSNETNSRPAQEKAAAAIVNALTKPPLRDELMGALSAATSDSKLGKQLDAVRAFDLDEHGVDEGLRQGDKGRARLPGSSWNIEFITNANAQDTSNPLKGFRVDLFYCEADADAATEARRRRAEEAGKKLRSDGGAAEIRVRLLPTLVQARPGYQAARDEIRYDEELDEHKVALRIAKVVNLDQQSVRRVNVRQTPGYISVFYCGGG